MLQGIVEVSVEVLDERRAVAPGNAGYLQADL